MPDYSAEILPVAVVFNTVCVVVDRMNHLQSDIF